MPGARVRGRRRAAGRREGAVRRGSGRAVLLAVLVIAVGVGCYVAARQTSIFALTHIEVEGATPAVSAEIRRTLDRYRGESLVRLDTGRARRLLTTVPQVAEARFDRDFPHTLKVRVDLERPVAVLRRGASAWLVSSRARVLRRLDQKPYPRLPRIWLPRSTDVSVNATIGGLAAEAVAAVAPLGPLKIPAEVRQVQATEDELTLVLDSGTELRLGNTGDLRLKLAIAKRLLPLTTGARYVDVSVPERPVAGYNPQVEG